MTLCKDFGRPCLKSKYLHKKSPLIPHKVTIHTCWFNMSNYTSRDQYRSLKLEEEATLKPSTHSSCIISWDAVGSFLNLIDLHATKMPMMMTRAGNIICKIRRKFAILEAGVDSFRCGLHMRRYPVQKSSIIGIAVHDTVKAISNSGENAIH